jgi:glycosyltransferase involved in cell wall biosynthesis
MTGPLLSVIVNNHNYGLFLRDAIESALAQTYHPVEVVVVDDGSTDDSRAIIEEYRASITAIYQQRQGHAAALDAGLAAASGDAVCFLDADDRLMPDTIERAVAEFEASDVVNVHWPLCVTDKAGQPTGEILPHDPLAPVLPRASIDRAWIPVDVSPPTSGHAWRTNFLRSVLPLPAPKRGTRRWTDAPDFALFLLGQVVGVLRSLPEPGGFYRLHGNNNSSSPTVAALAERQLPVFERDYEALAARCRELGLDVDPELWRRHSYAHRLCRAAEAMRSLIRPGERFILLDEDEFNHHFGNPEVIEGRVAVPFPEREGRFGGHPPDSATAVSELERMRAEGMRILVIAWSAFWWLDYYGPFQEHLRLHYRCLIDADYMQAFELTRHDD